MTRRAALPCVSLNTASLAAMEAASAELEDRAVKLTTAEAGLKAGRADLEAKVKGGAGQLATGHPASMLGLLTGPSHLSLHNMRLVKNSIAWL